MSNLYYKNEAVVLGNVGNEPDIKSLQNGSKLATFSVATSESWKDKASGEKREETEWHRIVVWNEGLVDVIERNVHKGDRVQVTGALKTRKWQDKDGQDRYTTEIVLKPYRGELQLLTDKRNGSGQTTSKPTASDYSPRSNTRPTAPSRSPQRQDMDDEIPF